MKLAKAFFTGCILFFLVNGCKNETNVSAGKNPKEKNNFSIRSFAEFDTIYIGESSMFHVLIKNNTKKKVIVLSPYNELYFAPHKGINTDEFRARSYNGPAWHELLPGDETDCGYTGLIGFFDEMPLGKSTLEFTLKFYLKHLKQPIIFTDSFPIFVKPARLKMSSVYKEELKDGKKRKLLEISIQNISNSTVTLGDANMSINFYDVPKGWKARELIVEDYNGPGRYELKAKETYHRTYDIDYYFPQMTKGNTNLIFGFSYCILRGERKDYENYGDTLKVIN